MRGELSRRATLGALMAAPVAGLITAIPITAVASANGAEWYHLKARYDAAKAEEDAYNRDVCDPTEAILDARTGGRPQMWFEVTARSGQTARYWLRAPDFDQAPSFGPFAEHAARIKAEWERWDHLNRIWTDRLNLEAIRERSTALGDLRFDLEKELVRTPAPDLAALLWKIENLWGCSTEDGSESSDSINMEWVRPVIEDCRRLLADGRSA